MASPDRFIELLNQSHDFPAEVMVKVIGHNRPGFVAEVVAAVEDECGPAGRSTGVREAEGGRHVAVTVEPEFASAESVLALYARLREIEGVIVLL